MRRPISGFSYIEITVALLVGSTVTAMATPSVLNTVQKLRTNGDAREIGAAVSLAKLRAASDFTHARVYADLSGNTVQVQVWDRTNNVWTTEGSAQTLQEGDTYGYAALSAPPANTQATIGQAPLCQTTAQTQAGTAGSIASTACIIFNSRGIPIDYTGTADGNYALYVTNGSSIWAVTVTGTGIVQTWRSDSSSAHWARR